MPPTTKEARRRLVASPSSRSSAQHTTVPPLNRIDIGVASVLAGNLVLDANDHVSIPDDIRAIISNHTFALELRTARANRDGPTFVPTDHPSIFESHLSVPTAGTKSSVPVWYDYKASPLIWWDHLLEHFSDDERSLAEGGYLCIRTSDEWLEEEKRTDLPRRERMVKLGGDPSALGPRGNQFLIGQVAARAYLLSRERECVSQMIEHCVPAIGTLCTYKKASRRDDDQEEEEEDDDGSCSEGSGAYGYDEEEELRRALEATAQSGGEEEAEEEAEAEEEEEVDGEDDERGEAEVGAESNGEVESVRSSDGDH